jgi:hypothetical protein
VGFSWSKFADVLKVVGPVILSTIPGVPPMIVPAVINAITAAQMMPGATGPAKKAAVLAEVVDGLEIANGILIAKGKSPVGDPAVISASVGAGIDAVITTVQAVKLAHDTAPPVVPEPVPGV